MSKPTKYQWQQGDVIGELVPVVPAGCKAIKDKRGAVLAEGEITGHYHAVEDTEGVELLEAPDRSRFLVVAQGSRAVLTHQEHKPVTIPPGRYRIGQVREKDWFQDMVRTVRD